MRKVAISVFLSLLAMSALGLALFFFLRSSEREFTATSGGRELASGDSVYSSSADSTTGKSGAKEEVGGDDSEEEDPADAAGATLSGTVTSEFNEPLESARVFVLEDRDLLSPRGSRGRFSFDDMREVIRKRVLDQQPVLNRTVIAETVADSDGKYSFSVGAIPPGDYRVYAYHDDYATQSESWKRTPESHVIDFRLGIAQWITGVVINQRDQPVAMASVEAFAQAQGFGGRGFGGRGRGGGGFGRGGASVESQTYTDSDGYFQLSLSSGTYRLRATAEGYTPGAVADVDAGTVDILIVLSPSTSLSGKVVDVDGKPLEAVTVALYTGGFVGRGGRGGRNFGRGGRGRFRNRNAGDESQNSASEDRELTSPAAGPWRWLSAPHKIVESDAKGEFRFEDIPRERFALVAKKSGYVTSESIADRSRPGTEERLENKPEGYVELVLAKGAVISGSVEDHLGEPVSGAFVALGPEEREGGRRGRGGGRRRGRRPGRDQGEIEDAAPAESEGQIRASEPISLFALRAGVETDQEGRFFFDALPRGEYSLSVESERYPVFLLEQLHLEEDQTVDISLEEGMTLHGRVLSAGSKEPLSDAVLRFTIGDSNTKTVKSGEDGKYELSGFLSSTIEEVTIAAPGHSTTYFGELEVESNEERDFEIPRAAEIKGRVINTRGEPVYKARVSLRPAVDLTAVDLEDPRNLFRETIRQTMRESAAATTDVDGNFHLKELTGEVVYNVSAEHPDYQRLEAERVEPKPGEISEITLELKMGARIDVSVQDPEGTPVPGARVLVRREVTQEEPQSLDFSQPAAGAEGNARGRGRSRFGDPRVRQRLARVVQGDQGVGERRSRSTGPDGKAVFSGMVSGVFLVQVEARGFQHFYVQTFAADEAITPVVADLLPENIISGQILDAMGEPIAGVQVTATRDSPDPASLSSGGTEWSSNGFGFRRRSNVERSEARSRSDGTFQLGQLANATYTLLFRARGFSELQMEKIAVNRSLQVVMERLGSVAGWVRIAATALPIVSFRLRLQEEATADESEDATGAAESFGGRGRFDRGRRRGQRWRTYEDPEGAFLVENLNPGSYTLEVVAEGYTGESVNVDVASGQMTEVVVSLEEGLSVSGVVVRKISMEPIPDAVVYLLPVAEEEVAAQEIQEEASRPRARRERLTQRPTEVNKRESETDEMAVTEVFAALQNAKLRANGEPVNEDGTFKLLEVPEGRYLLVVDHEGYVPAVVQVELVLGSVVADHVIQLDPGETLEGTVTLEGREPGAGLTVIANTADGYSRRTETDVDGRYFLTGLVPGDYSVSIRLGSQSIVQNQAVKVTDDSDNKFDYEPERKQ